MSGMWFVVGLPIVVLAGLALYTVLVMRQIGTPTRGGEIDLNERPNTALVVIDVQEDFTRNGGSNPFEPAYRDAALAVINRSVSSARSAGNEIVFIKHVFRNWLAIQIIRLVAKGVGTPGRKGLEIDPSIEVGEAPVFEKAIGDSFSSAAFEDWLETRKVGKLILTGLDSCHCVQLTAKGALARGYLVEIRDAATLTATPEKWSLLKEELGDSGAVIV
ncbi:cysteine hydrolase [uncultured Roseibium sp.]|uniref:cysteine hydrolase family protein n=1 Tax=uncultured Roseibium sp. TaxID=1936171 RepID=UPI00260C69C6|nr:cysteine hydrolase [uncultured Roseibium sp.]